MKPVYLVLLQAREPEPTILFRVCCKTFLATLSKKPVQAAKIAANFTGITSGTGIGRPTDLLLAAYRIGIRGEL